MIAFDKNSALLVIDMLNDFVREGRSLEVPAARQIIPAIQEAIEAARRGGAKVIYVCDHHIIDDPEFKAWPRHAVIGTEGSEVVEELAPEEGDIIVGKRYLLPFYNNDLDGYLRENDIKRVVLSGVLTDICIYHAAADASVRGYNVTVLQDCVAALSEEDHNFALRQMERLFKANIERVVVEDLAAVR